MPDVSFVIPAYNEQLELPATLDAIRIAGDQINRSYEIIVADDASTDDTARIATDHGARVVSVEHRQIAATRNSGAKEAKGDILIFVDADTRVTPAVVAAAVAAIQAGAVGGGCWAKFENVGRTAHVLLWIVQNLLRVFRVSGGCFMFMTHDAFKQTGGFDEHFYASEEAWMSRALRKLKQGRFILLREHVVTSGRKLRMYTLRTLMFKSLRVLARGPAGVKSRDRLELWYDGKREGP